MPPRLTEHAADDLHLACRVAGDRLREDLDLAHAELDAHAGMRRVEGSDRFVHAHIRASTTDTHR